MKAQIEGGACCEAYILPEGIKLLAIPDTRVVTGMGGTGDVLAVNKRTGLRKQRGLNK